MFCIQRATCYLIYRKEMDSDLAKEVISGFSRDAVAARTLSVMQMDPMQFLKSIDRGNRKFPSKPNPPI